MSRDPEIRSTVGAVVAGCMTSVALSAVLGFQTFLYFQVCLYGGVRDMALTILDATHTVLICTAVWQYAIENFGNNAVVTTIFPYGNVAITAITTLTSLPLTVSKQNWWLTMPIIFLCIARVVTTVELIITKTFPKFAAHFNIILICGMSVSAATDIIVSAARYYYLRNLKQGYTGTQEVVDAVVVFTINDGCLTCAVVLAAIACLLRMPHNFIWLGIYFTIAKFYSNSVLATLNLRNWYRHRPRPMGIPLPRPTGLAMQTVSTGSGATGKRSAEMHSRTEVFVDQQVEYNVTVDLMHRHNDEEAHSTKSGRPVRSKDCGHIVV
ncbi:hypothetical protein C8F04DRAFT_1073764 [Mycena alexandri]|uniref:DUF6534 domain-containing protein n=1 Tax=Mycena alexandri TaxID=1745969 RepID=A0AAD6TAZ8_9AGAR|nr:hypothetical protein C8F04DRAFT_1073764 [Mycena alexandri]